jgi:hypothetical protein
MTTASDRLYRARGPNHSGEACRGGVDPQKRAINGPRGRTSPAVMAVGTGGVAVKKGRHRRFEEARSLKRATASAEPCPECGAEPEDIHASWCLAEEDQYEKILGSAIPRAGGDDYDPLAEG